MLTAWVSIDDLRQDLLDEFEGCIGKGYSSEAAIAKAAALLAVNRDQIANPNVSIGVVKVILGLKLQF